MGQHFCGMAYSLRGFWIRYLPVAEKYRLAASTNVAMICSVSTKSQVFAKPVAMLSLTRAPDNAMWKKLSSPIYT